MREQSKTDVPPPPGVVAVAPPEDVPPEDVPPEDVPPEDVPPDDVPPDDVPPEDVPPEDVPPDDVPVLPPVVPSGSIVEGVPPDAV